MGKTSKRRPKFISDKQESENWDKAFGIKFVPCDMGGNIKSLNKHKLYYSSIFGFTPSKIRVQKYNDEPKYWSLPDKDYAKIKKELDKIDKEEK